jgi:DNA ligase-1
MEGSLDKLKQYLNDSSLVGKMLTVRYQGFTINGIPRFPIGIAIRDYE